MSDQLEDVRRQVRVRVVAGCNVVNNANVAVPLIWQVPALYSMHSLLPALHRIPVSFGNEWNSFQRIPVLSVSLIPSL